MKRIISKVLILTIAVAPVCFAEMNQENEYMKCENRLRMISDETTLLFNDNKHMFLAVTPETPQYDLTVLSDMHNILHDDLALMITSFSTILRLAATSKDQQSAKYLVNQWAYGVMYDLEGTRSILNHYSTYERTMKLPNV